MYIFQYTKETINLLTQRNLYYIREYVKRINFTNCGKLNKFTYDNTNCSLYIRTLRFPNINVTFYLRHI